IEQEFGFRVNQSTISRILLGPIEFSEETNCGNSSRKRIKSVKYPYLDSALYE
ncbi:20373_t:CDS:2, partial [Dentiscutata erythropus]